MDYIDYDTFKKMDMRIGTIRAVEPVAGADKLLKFQIEFGTKLVPPEDGEPAQDALPPAALPVPVPDIRQIVSGIREYYPDYEALEGKQVLYIVNLAPRTIRGEVSNGMLMAVDGLDGRPVFLLPEVPVAPGASVR